MKKIMKFILIICLVIKLPIQVYALEAVNKVNIVSEEVKLLPPQTEINNDTIGIIIYLILLIVAIILGKKQMFKE